MRRRCLCSLVIALGCTEVRDPPSVDHFATTGEATGSTMATADDGSTGANTADPPQSPALAACAAHCARRHDCGSTLDPYLCEQACIDALLAEIDLVECVEAHVAALLCAAGLTCDGLASPADHGCAEEVAAQQTACDTRCTLASSSTDPATAVCQATFACGPTERTLRCEGETCACAVGDETTATCSTEPDCPMQVALLGGSWWWETASACCGWAESGS